MLTAILVLKKDKIWILTKYLKKDVKQGIMLFLCDQLKRLCSESFVKNTVNNSKRLLKEHGI